MEVLAPQHRTSTAIQRNLSVRAANAMKTNAHTRIRLEATFQIMWCFPQNWT